MTRPATFGRIASDVEKIAFFMALRTNLGRSRRGNGVATFVALPISQAAIRTYVAQEFTRRRVAAQSTLHLSFSLFHLMYLPF